MSIAPDILALIVLIISFYNNPYRFSGEKNAFGIHQTTYLIYFVIIILQVMVLYFRVLHI